MSSFSFNVAQRTQPAATYAFAGNQQQKAVENHVSRVFRFRDLHGNVDLLPQYVKAAIRAAGFEPFCLGGTTFSHSVIGLAPIASA